MFYCGTNQRLQFYLSGAVTTNELPYVSTAITTADAVASKNGVSNGVTAVDLCDAAAGLVRHFEIYNADTTDATIYVIYNDNGTTRIVHQEVIQSGYTLVYDSESGWAVTPSQSGLVSHSIDGAAHTVTGRTAGQVLRATSANTFGWSTATYPNTVESGALLVATGTNAIGTLGVGLTTQVLVGGGAATVPSWSTDLPTALTIGGAYIYRAGGTDVAVADGGTGLSTLGTANQLLGVNNAATALEYKSLLGTTNQISVTNAAGSITLALPQDIHTAATPTFGALNLGSASGAGTGDVKGSGVLQMAGTGTHYVLGNFAVGTAAPTAKLDIVPSSSSDVVFRTKSLQSTAPLGSELVSNGNFSTVPDTSWTWGTGWTHDTTNLEADHATGNTAALTQNISVTNGQTYQVEITIKNRTAGSVTLDINGVYIYDYGTINTLSANITYKRSLVANITGTATLRITPTSDFNGSVDDISVKQITGVSQPNFSLLDDAGSVVAELRGKSSLGNIALGASALRRNTTGVSNSAIGMSALYSNTTGNSNSAIGVNALYSNTTGYQNSAIGVSALQSNTTGILNSAIGVNALSYNTTGYRNSAIGVDALYSNTTGYQNSAIGVSALQSNTTGYSNSAIGVSALQSNTTGYRNSAIGVSALQSNTTGYQNSAIGMNAGRYIASGGNNQTSSNSVYLGYDTRAAADGDTNEIVIGASAIGFGSNTAAYGNSSITKHIFHAGNVGIGTTSPTYTLSFGGNSARTIWMERHTTENTTGNALTVQAGGATVGATNKAGGDLLLKPGASTGNAESGVQIYGCVAGASGTADGTMSVALQVLGNKIGFFGATPVAKQTGCAVPTDLESCIAAITALRTALNNYGLTTVV